MQKKHRPIGITILAILSGLAAIIALVVAIQYFFLPFKTPNIQWSFFGAPWLSGILWLVTAFIYFWLMRMLWQVNPQGWLFLVLISIFELILAFVSVLGKTSLSAMIPTILVSGIILLYCLYPGTKAAFGTDKLAQPAPPPPPAPPAK